MSLNYTELLQGEKNQEMISKHLQTYHTILTIIIK